MAHNQHMLEKHGDRWGDKVRIIGISIDQGADAVVKHVKAKKWEKVEHYWRGASSCSEDYGVGGVPHVVLIDGAGTIAFVGHPASRKLEEDIETLLKGEKLKGISSGGDAQGEEADPSFKELDLEKVDAEIKLFASKAHELTSNATIKSAASNLQRGLVVVSKISKYQPASGKLLTQY